MAAARVGVGVKVLRDLAGSVEIAEVRKRTRMEQLLLPRPNNARLVVINRFSRM